MTERSEYQLFPPTSLSWWFLVCGDHMEDRLANAFPKRFPHSVCVPPLEHDKLSRKGAGRGAGAYAGRDRWPGSYLVAHSAGCITTVRWAQNAARQIHSALLATPTDVDSAMPIGCPHRSSCGSMAGAPCRQPACRFPQSWRPAAQRSLAQLQSVPSNAGQRLGCTAGRPGPGGYLNPVAGFTLARSREPCSAVGVSGGVS